VPHCIPYIHIKFLYELTCNQASQIWDNKIPSSDNTWPQPSSVSPVRVTNFSATQHGAKPSLVCLQAMPFGSLLHYMKCYQKLSQYPGKLKCNLLFSTAFCIIVITWFIAVSLDLIEFVADCYRCRCHVPMFDP
jgi:hypothetical protein